MFDHSEDFLCFRDFDSILDLILNLLKDVDEVDVLTFLSYSTGLKFKRITNVSRLLLSLLLFVPNYMLLNKHKHLPATDFPFLDISESESDEEANNAKYEIALYNNCFVLYNDLLIHLNMLSRCLNSYNYTYGNGQTLFSELATYFNKHIDNIKKERSDLINIDTNSKYRYFSTQQFECLNTIRYLRILDMPLNKIAEFLKNRDINKIQKMLSEQKETVIKKQQELKIIEKKIDNRLKNLKTAINAKLDTIEVKQIEKRRIVPMNNNLEINSYIDADFETSIRKLEQNQKEAVVFLGKVGLGISKEHFLKKQFKNYNRVFLILDNEDMFNGKIEEIPQEICVSICFCGSHKDASKYYEKLMKYIEKHKLKISGFSKEISMIDFGITNDTSKFVTEIQIPIEQE